MQIIYLDNNATTRIDDGVLKSMLPYLKNNWGNPSNISHSMGRIARDAIDIARVQLSKFIGCQSQEVIFTSGATESNAMAINFAVHSKKIKTIITSDAEHLSVISNCYAAVDEPSNNMELLVLPVGNAGALTVDQFKAIENLESAFVSLIWVNNETGIINPVEPIVDYLKSRGAIVHIDATQVPGKLKIDVSALKCDFLTLSAHKMYGPKGVGALYIRSKLTFSPFIFGGGQERGLRSGTENVASIVGFGTACEMLETANLNNLEEVSELRMTFVNELQKILPDTKILNDKDYIVPHTLLCGWHGVENTEILRQLDMQGIMASAGSACSSSKVGQSRILRAMKISNALASSSIRFSLGKYNTRKEVLLTCKALGGIIPKLQKEMR